MSKRYGKNQKRKHRESTALLTKEISRKAFAIGQLRYENAALQEELSNAKQIAGYLSIVFPASKLKTNDPERPYWELPVEPTYAYSISDAIPATRSFTVQRLDVLLNKIEPGVLATARHMIIDFRGESYGYAINAETAKTLPTELLSKMLARELSQVIANRFKLG